MKQWFKNVLVSLRSSGGASAPPTQPGGLEVKRLIDEIRAAHLTYCGPPKLENLSEAVMRVCREGVKGDFIEAGVALGGSAILLGKLKPSHAILRLYDVFSMIPPPGTNDGEDAHQRYHEIRSGNSSGLGGNTYYGYMDQLLEQVAANLATFGLDCEADHIELVPGLFDDTLHPQGAVACAHVDCDWYDPVRICIDRILPKLSCGGVLVFDDYSSYSGCRRAVDELLAQRNDLEVLFHRRSIGLRRVLIRAAR